ncbi:MAG TPA: pseudouridine synthase [Balneolales bacterium]|nr:pseudouridine synthase [Balneolales bacterium]
MPHSENGIITLTMSSKKEKSQNSFNSNNVRIVKPYPFTHHFNARKADWGLSLLDMMTLRFPFKSREDWAKRITDGYVKVNDLPVGSDYCLDPAHTISHYNPNVKEPSVPDEIEIVDETRDYLVLIKPAPMPVHPGGRYYKNTLIEILKARGYTDLKIIHRLDAVTSGLLILGKNPSFTREAFRCFREGKVKKQYYALVSGRPIDNETEISVPIRRKQGFRFECDHSGSSLSKPAFSRFEVRERYKSHSLIACFPVTGRTHQLRLHLQHWGYPVFDDPIYGLAPSGRNSLQKRGIALYNAQISIPELNIDYLLSPPYEWKLLITEEQ